MKTFSAETVTNTIGLSVVWAGVLLYKHLRNPHEEVALAEPGKKTNSSNDDGGKEKTVVVHERFYFPPDIVNDLKDVDLPPRVKEEVFATAWEYSRTVIPHYTNWSRYVAFMRIIIIGTIAEFRGSLIDVVNSDDMLGYKLSEVLATLFEGTPGHAEMSREFRCFLLMSSQKSCRKTNTVLFRRYCAALAGSPWQFFRMRDTDALGRFTIAAALACNDLDDVWFTDDQFDILAEIGDTMPWLFGSTVPRAREALWALDAAWKTRPELQVVINFVRYFGGPTHMMMRRYRFVEEGLTVGKRETERVIAQTRRNYKLWNRVDQQKTAKHMESESLGQYRHVISQEKTLLFNGLAGILERTNDAQCTRCWHRETYGAASPHTFGGVQLCAQCKEKWRAYANSLFPRMIKTFPEVAETLRMSEMRATSA